MSAMGENWTPEEWASWAKSMEGSTRILERGEKVVMPPPSTPRVEALQEKHGVKPHG